MSPSLILDCDPGLDDAIAILCAHRYGRLLGITTVNGNVSVDKTTHNALLVTQIADLDTPVHCGASRPLVEVPRYADHIHGESGLNGPVLPELRREVSSVDAISYLLDMSRSNDDLWVVATGPLTNIAHALDRDPAFIDRLAGLVLMGGSATGGNVTAMAEFNIFADPEAAAVVLSSGSMVTMVGLNLTHQVRMDGRHTASLRADSSATGAFVGDLIDFYASTTDADHLHGGAAIHDPCAVLAVTHPGLFGGVDLPVHVELRGQHTRGMTVVDQRPSSTTPPNAHVLFDVDAPAAIELIMAASVDPRGGPNRRQ